MTNLENWLGKHRTEGELVDEGDFTLSKAEALRKASQFGLETPERGLLRLVQLALSKGCRDINILFSPSMVTLKFSELEFDFENPEELLQLDNNNFGLALIACLHSGFESGQLLTEGAAWVFNREHFRRSSHQAKRQDLVVLRLQRSESGGFWGRLKRLLQQRCVDYKFLYDKLQHAPENIRLDSLQLQGDARPNKALLCELYLEGPADLTGLAIARPPKRPSRFVRTRRSKLDTKEKSWQTYDSSERRAKLYFFNGPREGWGKYRGKTVLLAHLWVPSSKRTRGRLFFVSDGVVIEELEPEFRVPLCGVVSAAGLERDLSCLELVHNDKLQSFMNYLYKEIHKQLKSIAKLRAKNPAWVNSMLKNGGYLRDKEEKKSKKGPSKPENRPPAQSKLEESVPSHSDFKSSRQAFNVQRKHLRNQGRY